MTIPKRIDLSMRLARSEWRRKKGTDRYTQTVVKWYLSDLKKSEHPDYEVSLFLADALQRQLKQNESSENLAEC